MGVHAYGVDVYGFLCDAFPVIVCRVTAGASKNVLPSRRRSSIACDQPFVVALVGVLCKEGYLRRQSIIHVETIIVGNILQHSVKIVGTDGGNGTGEEVQRSGAV